MPDTLLGRHDWYSRPGGSLSAKSSWQARLSWHDEHADQPVTAGQDDDADIEAAYGRYRPQGQAGVHGQKGLNSRSPRSSGTTGRI
jgi:hypothetical protein